MFEDYDPGLGITRIRYNGYNLSLKVRHPSEISAAKVRKKTEVIASESSLYRKTGCSPPCPAVPSASETLRPAKNSGTARRGSAANSRTFPTQKVPKRYTVFWR